MENIKILCDTDVIIEYLKGRTTKKIFNKLERINIALSVTLMELYYGTLNMIELNKKSHGLKIPNALIASTAIYYDLSL